MKPLYVIVVMSVKESSKLVIDPYTIYGQSCDNVNECMSI
jgi:hypothetical protein